MASSYLGSSYPGEYAYLGPTTYFLTLSASQAQSAVLNPAGVATPIGAMQYPGGYIPGSYATLSAYGVVYTKTLSASQAQAATLGQLVYRLYLQVLSATQGQSASLSQQFVYARELIATQAQIASLLGAVVYGKELSASQAQTATLVRIPTFFKTMSATQGQTATLTRVFAYGRPWLTFISIDGVVAGVEWMSIEDLIDETPNTLQVKLRDVTITTGMEVIAALAAIDNPDGRIFAGHIINGSLTSDADYSPTTPLVEGQFSAIDYSWGLDRKKINRTWVATSISTIIADVMAEPITRGYTVSNVTGGLAATTISFINADVSACLKQLASILGVGFKVDYFKDLHFPSSVSVASPITLDVNHQTLRNFHSAEDLSQIVTRGVTKGDGSTAFEEIAVGSTILPVLSGDPFSSGIVQVKAQRLTYTGMSADGGRGTTAAGISQSVGSLSAAVAGVGGNLVAGAYSYKQTAINAKGDESEPGSAGSVTIIAVTAPAAPTVAASAGATGNLPAATYGYKVGFKTKTGVTLPGTAGSGAVGAVSAPGASTVAASSGVTGNLPAATYGYKIGYKTSDGTTLPGSAASAAISAVTAPGPPSVAVTSGVSGSLGVGQFLYKTGYKTSAGVTLPGTSFNSASIVVVSRPTGNGSATGTTGGALTPSTFYAYRTSYVDAVGETLPVSGGGTNVTLTGAQNAVTFSSIPTSSDGRVLKRNIWRDTGNTGVWRLVGTLNDNTTTTFLDTLADSSWAVAILAPTVDTSGSGKMSLTSIPTSGDGRVTGRVIYRTKVGGAVYYELATLNDNTTTVYTDNTPDSSLTVEVPTVQTSDFGKMSLTSIPTSADGRVTGRVIFRTLAGGSVYFELATLNDNTTTVYTDNTPDSSLTLAAPTVQTSDFGKMAISAIPTSADARVTGRVLFRTLAGGAVYYELATLNDNSTSTYLDNTPDDSLTIPAPSVLTDLTSPDNDKVSLSSIAAGPAGTVARKIYRTLMGGSVYRVAFTIGDNVTTVYTDNVNDTSLGLEITTQSEWRNPAGSTTQPVEDLSIFTEGKGWLLVGSQQVYFTGGAAASGRGNLTGIPATGVGSLAADVTFGTTVVCQPYLKGIPASGAGSILYTILKGDAVNLIAIYNDATAQAAFATRMGDGSDGIVEDLVDAGEVAYADALAQSTARVVLFGYPLTNIEYDCHDPLSVSGAIVAVSLPSPQNVSGSFRIQEVTLTNFNQTPPDTPPLQGQYPNYHVKASSQRYSLEQILKALLAGQT